MSTAVAKLAAPDVEVIRRRRPSPTSGMRAVTDGDAMEVRALGDACEEQARRAGLAVG